MRKLLHKLTTIFAAVMMVGLYVPPTTPNPEASDDKEPDLIKPAYADNGFVPVLEEETEQAEDNSPVGILAEKAREMTMYKLGPKITSKVEDELLEVILPHMEEIIQQITLQADEDLVPYFEITENPSTGDGERIFNLYNRHTKEDIAKFHVRRDKRPLEGYWFNFHYHLNTDQFETHYPIGEIYWDKNTPPKWMVH